MSFEEQRDFARQVADLNKYGQALNRCETVEEVVSLTLEAMSLLFDFSYATFIEIRDDDLFIVHSTNPEHDPGESPSEVAYEAYERRETVEMSGAEAGIPDDSDVTATVAVPAETVDQVTAILVTRSRSLEEFTDAQIRPLEILASHAATAISNIRSRERLERAREELETRNEMLQMYDRLLRHDLGNDLQVIAGFADALTTRTDGDAAEYARKIQNAAESSADLIERVGDLVSTLEAQEEPESRPLREILEPAVENAREQYESLSVEFDPGSAEYTVYSGELLDSVFTNILTNAAVHNDGDVTVEVYVEEPDLDTVVVGFADDGSGIPEDVREELFKMGVKGDESGGTGFGLGFVRALTESYGGDVAVRDSEYGGADFRVTLQRA
ncbi:MAG: ATP-binding protein [Haloarculaceae archaeon]